MKYILIPKKKKIATPLEKFIWLKYIRKGVKNYWVFLFTCEKEITKLNKLIRKTIKLTE